MRLTDSRSRSFVARGDIGESERASERALQQRCSIGVVIYNVGFAHSKRERERERERERGGERERERERE
jgi:short-subunit dehydrogenase